MIDRLVDKELGRRADLVEKGLELLDKAQGELAKIKPDIRHFDGSLKLANELFSEAQKKKFEEGRKTVRELESALVNALEKSNYKQLEGLTKKGGNSDSQS